MTRYGGGGIDQRENRLTEVTTAMIEHAAGIGAAFTQALRPATPVPGQGWEVERVYTQKHESGRFVDLVPVRNRSPSKATVSLNW